MSADKTFSNAGEFAAAVGHPISNADVTINLYTCPCWGGYVTYNANGGTISTSETTEFRLTGDSEVQRSTDGGSTYNIVQTMIFEVEPYKDLWNVASFKLNKTGYHIVPTKAWNTSADGDGVDVSQQNTANDAVNAATTERLMGPVSGPWQRPLYANWQPNTYTIQYNASGGTGSMQSSDFSYGEPDNLRANGFSGPAGERFTGWATSPERAAVGLTDFDDGQEIVNLTATDGDLITLYAVWSESVTTMRNTTTPGFDISTYKYGPNPTDQSQDEPLKGAVLSIYEINRDFDLDTTPITLPPMLQTKTAFIGSGGAFQVSSDGKTLSMRDGAQDASSPQLTYVATMETDASGFARTYDALLSPGHAYAIIETASPGGYKIDSDNPTIYIVDDYTSTNDTETYAHILYPESAIDEAAGQQVDRKSSDGTVQPHKVQGDVDYPGFYGYRVSYTSDTPTVST